MIARDATRIVDVHAYLVHALTGEWATSLACADPMGIVDMRRGAWATDLIRDIGLRPDQFVPIAAPGSLLARVNPDAAAATGVPAGTPVIAGAGDGQAASLGAGVTGAGRAFVNLGTAIAGGAVSDRYVTDLRFSHLRRRHSRHLRPGVGVAGRHRHRHVVHGTRCRSPSWPRRL